MTSHNVYTVATGGNIWRYCYSVNVLIFSPSYGSGRSRIFLRRRPLSCAAPSPRDSVGGGVVAGFFGDLRKPAQFSEGVVPFIHGPFYISRLPQRGGPGRGPPLNRPLYQCMGLHFQIIVSSRPLSINHNHLVVFRSI